MVQRRTVRRRHAAGEGDRCVRECAEWADGRVLADNGATTAPMVTTQPDGRWKSVSPARRRESVLSLPALQQQPDPERNVCRGCQDGADTSLEVMQDNAIADGAMANTLG